MPGRSLAAVFKIACIALALSGFVAITICLSEAAELPRQVTPEELSKLSIEELVQVRITPIASGTEKPESQAPAVTSVITAADMAAMGATTLEEALDTVPGLHVSRSSPGYRPKYLIRGISTRFNPQTILLINNVPIVDLVTGRAGMSLPLSMVSRVEVIRGPGSAFYGANAFAGVINIVTKSTSEIRDTEVGARAGSFNTQRAWLLHGIAGADPGGIRLALMADYLASDGPKPIIDVDAQTRLDGNFGTSASLAPGPVNLSQKELNLLLDAEWGAWRLRGSLQSRNNLGSGEGFADALDPETRLSNGRTLLDLAYQPRTDGSPWDLALRFSHLHLAIETDKGQVLFPPGANLGSGVFAQGLISIPDIWQRLDRLTASTSYSGLERHRVRIGAGVDFGHIYRVEESKNYTLTFAPRPELTDVTDTPEVFLPENSRFSFHFYAQDEWSFHDDWELTAGIRYDRYSDFGGTANPRVALVWQATSSLTAKALYGRAFRAPLLNELYLANNPAVLGNPNLKPESIDVLELAGSYEPGSDWRTTLNLFYYQAHDLITYVVDPSGTSTRAQNFTKQHGSGLELEARLKATESFYLTGNYALVKTRNVTAGKPAGGFPSHQLYLRGNWEPLANWHLGSQLTWVGNREREPNDPRPELKGYATVDLTLRRRRLLNEDLELAASVRNLLDADVREPSNAPRPNSTAVNIPNDLPQAGRSVYLELSYRL